MNIYHNENNVFSIILNLQLIIYIIQHYVIKFVSDLRQVSGFLRVLRFPPPIKLTAMK
jgi:branched-subunit amino acid transport protein